MAKKEELAVKAETFDLVTLSGDLAEAVQVKWTGSALFHLTE